MTDPVPEWRVPTLDAAPGIAGLGDAIWDGVPALPPLQLADGSGPARFATAVRIALVTGRLHVRFDSDDADIWGTYTRRDDPIYEQEAVEVFLAPGAQDPRDYYEFEISPFAVVLDARISNPTSERPELRTDVAWDCPGLGSWAFADPSRALWRAEIAIPLAELAGGAPPPLWRANFCRIERPRGSEAEFSCWSPTRTRPADFHKPARFGFLRL